MARMHQIQKLLRATPSMRIQMLESAWRRLVTRVYYRRLFQSIGSGSVIFGGSMICNSEFMRIGQRVTIRRGCRLEVVLHEQPWEPQLTIGSDVNIEQNVHIVCHDQLTIEDNVSIAAMCAIVDTSHPPEAARLGQKIGSAISNKRSTVVIGENSFLGVGVTVLPDVTIGRNCVIGAGAVVTASVPPGSIAAGVPARVIGRVGDIDGDVQRAAST
jgi:acetyltransferase-like isoleucine patch superfamily enzyme